MYSIAIYNENCVRSGDVAILPDDLDEPSTSDDVTIYHGTGAQIEAQARKLLAASDPRPGGSGAAYSHRVGRSLLAEIGVLE